MAVRFDRWTALKLVEVVCVLACMIFKRVTDDEALRLFLYLQKISREWSLLNNITWDRIGSAVADTTYGGYVIITGALFIGRLVGELPTHKRITEFVLLGIGTILFIVLGSLELAALDSVPPDLVDNAAILGGVSLLTAVLFLIDMGGPKAKRTSTHAQTVPRSVSKPLETRTISQQVYEIEREIDRSEKTHLDSPKVEQKEVKNGHAGQNGVKKESKNGERTKRFGIYGKDVLELEEQKGDSEWEDIPPKMAAHSPVWSHIRKGQYGKLETVRPSYIFPGEQQDVVDRPSGPSDPGYVQYTAQHWGEPAPKTPRHSPTQV